MTIGFYLYYIFWSQLIFQLYTYVLDRNLLILEKFLHNLYVFDSIRTRNLLTILPIHLPVVSGLPGVLIN